MHGFMRLILLCFTALEFCWARQRIVGGRRAKEGEFPYQLSLRYNGFHLCGAALLNEVTALTAAHCFPKDGVYSVRAGSLHLNQGGVEVRVRTAIKHPYHKLTNQDNDIAIIKLEYPLNYSSSIQPVKLPNLREDISEGRKGYVSGWGSLSSLFEEPSEHLMAVRLPVLPISYCRSRYFPIPLSERMFCAGYREGGRDSCQGDSGGPYVIDGTLYGIVSWGFNCAEPGYPGIYTSVPMFRDFIKSNSGV